MKAIRIVAYVILSVLVFYFGSAFLKEYNSITERSAARGNYDIDDIETPIYDVDRGTDSSSSEIETPAEEKPAPDPALNGSDLLEHGDVSAANASSDDSNPAETNTVDTATQTAANETASTPDNSNRIGFFTGGFVLSLLALGLLAGYDLTRYSANRTLDSIYNDDGVGTDGHDLYEAAEQEWARGDFLEAIRILREYLEVNPKQQHAAIRIAEIYEKDLKSPLAAALEYEEILQQKLAPERWGWAAIHLANLYSGPMGKPEKAIDLLRQLVEKYPDTPAGEKASQRLAMIDGAE
ncbi:MAG: tetratricopeptide repeat protein [Verrucomicrobiota bacterium]